MGGLRCLKQIYEFCYCNLHKGSRKVTILASIPVPFHCKANKKFGFGIYITNIRENQGAHIVNEIDGGCDADFETVRDLQQGIGPTTIEL